MNSHTKRFSWPAALAAVGIAAMLIAGFLWWHFVESTKEVGRVVVDRGERYLDKGIQMAERFTAANITNTFRDRLSTVSSSSGSILEVAVIEADETFYKSDTKRTLWGKLDLGTTISEITVPVTYRYDVDLSEEWRLEVTDHVCLVIAPAIQPSLPVAIHTDGMKKRSERGWARWNADEQMEELEREITPGLNQRAGDKTDLASDKARLAVAEFVRTWLLEEDHWRSDRFSVIQVIFTDELPAMGGLKSIEIDPTIQLK